MIAIIGRGNVASHLYKALEDKTEVCLVNPRTLENLPKDPEIILISVSDNAIEEVLAKLPDVKSIIAHTAGSIPLNILHSKSENIGVIYPLQTFTKDVALNYSEIPVLIEGSTPEVTETLKNLAFLFSKNVKEIDSEIRKRLHLASVFICNFTNCLAGISKEILMDANMEFSVLMPLLKQTVNKLENLTPEEAQTGPAVRGDDKVIQSHLKLLKEKPKIKELYSLMSDIISEKRHRNEI